MNKYELAVVVSAKIEDDERAQVIEKVKALVERFGGKISDVDESGKKRLAYEIQKMKEAYYYFIHFDAEADVPGEIEQRIRIMDNVIRYFLFHGMCFLYSGSILESFFYLTHTRRTEPVFCLFHTVQRIAYPQPVDWEIIVGTENPITEHRIVQVPEFDQDTAARCFLCEMFEHIAEDFFCLFFVGRKRLVQKFAFTIYYTMFH